MTLIEYLNGLGDKPSTWNPSWAKSLADALAAEWSQVSGDPPVTTYQYVYDPDAYITESLLISLGIHGVIKAALTSARPAWAAPYISADDWLSIWPLLSSNKGNIYPKDALTQGLLGLMAGHGVITAEQADAVLDVGRRKKKVWEVAGLAGQPSFSSVLDAALAAFDGWEIPQAPLPEGVS